MTVAALVLSIVGVVIACCGFGWQVASYLLSAGRVKVAWSYAIFTNGMPPALVITATNVGRMPITVKQFSLRLPNGAG